MFTWICPTCGREVPPAYDECPDCAAKAKSPERPAETAAPPPPLPPSPAAAPPPVYAVPPPSKGVPTWLLSVLFAVVFVAVGAGIYWVAHSMRGGPQSPASTKLEPVPPKTPPKEHPLQRYVEVTGIRFVQTPKKETEARFVVVNHSGADITDLAGTVNIWGRTDKSEEEAAGSFAFRVPSLGPYESKEQTAVVKTKLKAYELPDWQNVSTEVQLTSP